MEDMENSTGFEVKFTRTVQVNQYEPAVAEIKAVFAAENSDVSIAERKLRECREAVESVLGIKSVSGAVERVEVASATPAVIAVAENTPTPTPEKKRVGRPTKEEAAKKLAEQALARANADPMDEILATAETQNISTGEDRSDPMADVLDDIPDVQPEPKAEEKPIMDQELQNEAGKAVQRLGDSNVVRAMVKTNYRVQRLDEVPPNLRRAVVNDLRNLQKDGTIKKADK
jgi:hypothetical protein